MRAARLAGLVLAAAGVLAGCGGAAQPAPSPHPSATPRPAAARPLLYVWRNFEFTGIPDEMTIYVNGEVHYRNLLHTQQKLRVLKTKLQPPELARVRRLLGDVDLRHADASGVKPRRDGYRYIIRSGGQVGTAADGHLHGPVRRLVVRLRAEMDRMQQDSL